MRVGVLGVNHRSAPLVVQEVFARASEKLFRSVQNHPFIDGYLLLTTCNRTEIYFSALDLAEAHTDFLHLLKREISLPFEQNIYSFFGVDCFEHLCQVITGLDSAIVAESDIQRQVKSAYESARLERFLPGAFHFLFQKALKIAKEIRTLFPMPRGVLTLEKIIFNLTDAICKEMEKASFFFIGNSQTNRKILTFFQAKGIRNVTFCTRTQDAALDWLKSRNVQISNWSCLPHWADYDIIIAATKYPGHVIASSSLSLPYKKRVLFDLSVPRNIDPHLALRPQVTLFNLEKLSRLIEEQRHLHFTELHHAHNHLRNAVLRQLHLFAIKERQRELVDTVCEFP